MKFLTKFWHSHKRILPFLLLSLAVLLPSGSLYPVVFMFAQVTLAAVFAHFTRKLFFPYVDLSYVYEQAMLGYKGAVPIFIVFVSFIFGLIFLFLKNL